MKKFLIALCLILPTVAQAAPCQLRLDQRNTTDTAYVMRIAPPVSCATDSILMHDSTTTLPIYAQLGTGLALSSGVLNISPPWTSLTGAPSTFAPSAHTHPAADINDSTATGRSVLTASDAAAARTAIGAGTSSFSGVYGDLTSIPSTFAPSAHTHAIADVTGLQTAIDGKVPTTRTVNGYALSADVTLTKGDVGLGNVDNTSDANKPISTATQTALNGKFANPTGTTAQVVLGNGTLGPLPVVPTQSVGEPSRAIVTSTSATGYQISATRNALACYEGVITTTSSIGGPSSGSIFLETANTNSTTPADWTTKAEQTNSQTITLAIVLQSVDGESWGFCRIIPAGKYVRLRSAVTSGTVSFSINATQQETLF